MNMKLSSHLVNEATHTNGVSFETLSEKDMLKNKGTYHKQKSRLRLMVYWWLTDDREKKQLMYVYVSKYMFPILTIIAVIMWYL